LLVDAPARVAVLVPTSGLLKVAVPPVRVTTSGLITSAASTERLVTVAAVVPS
jgi:hypothetical protein